MQLSSRWSRSRNPINIILHVVTACTALCGVASAQRRGRPGQETLSCGLLTWANIRQFAFNNNVWNPTVDGHQCIAIATDGSAFNVTWQWERGDISQPVHSFPYVRFESAYLPVSRLWDVTQLQVRATWDMFPTSDAGRNIEDTEAVSNAAIDMFLDLDMRDAEEATRASHEVMIWFGTYGGGAPFGNATGIQHQVTVQPDQVVTFNLFDGKKSDRDQRVLSWQTSPPVKRFDVDVLSFLRVLEENDMLSRDMHVGPVEFGTETFYSSENVTFTASNFFMNVTSNATATVNTRPGDNPPNSGTARVPGSPGTLWLVLLAVFLLSRYL